MRAEVAWLRSNDSNLALLPNAAGLGLPGVMRGPGSVALCRLMARNRSCPERYHTRGGDGAL